jgi:hypothetical protein
MNTTKTPQSTHTDAELFRTWWVGLPLERAKEVQQSIKEQLGWTSNTWYDRTSGRTNFQPAEKTLIMQITGENPFLKVEVEP